MSALRQHERLAKRHGWIVFDNANTTDHPWQYRSYGVQDVACLHVRYGHQHRVINAIYTVFDANIGDQLIHNEAPDKRGLIDYILINRPRILPSWGKDLVY